MENEILGLILIAVMLFAIFVGFPISFTLIFLGFVFGFIGFGQVVFYLMTFQFSNTQPFVNGAGEHPQRLRRSFNGVRAVPPA